MIIRESDMTIGSFGTNSILSMLESMSYLTEAEATYYPAMVPVLENSRLGAYTIAMEDLDKFCESNGISDMGYAVSQICEASQIDPANVVFTVQETTILANDEMANLVSDILSEGIGVVAVPISEYAPQAVLAEWACDTYAFTGDSSLLEAFVNDDYDALMEAFHALNNGTTKEKTIDRVNQLTDKGEIGKIEGYMKIWDANNPEPSRADKKKHAAWLEKRDAHKAGLWNISTTKPTERYDRGSSYRPGEGPGRIAKYDDKGKLLGYEDFDSNNPEHIKLMNDSNLKTKKSQQEQEERDRRNAERKAKYGDRLAAKKAAAAEGDTPKDPKTTEQSIWKSAKEAVSKGRDAIARKIAALNKWLQDMIDNGAADKNPSWWAKVKATVAKCIKWLTDKMHSTIKTDKYEERLAAANAK